MVLAPCKLKRIREMITLQFAAICGLQNFCGKMDVSVVIYKGKDKNITQENLIELECSLATPIWCK